MRIKVLIFTVLIMLSCVAGCSVPAQTAMAAPREEMTVQTVESEEVPAAIDEIAVYRQMISTLQPSPTLSQIKHDIKTTRNLTKEDQYFPQEYSKLEGVLTFRGDGLRNNAAWGRADIKDKRLEIIWSSNTGFRSFGGGGGWTGQPAVVKWPEEIKKIMNIEAKFKEMKDFTEVIFASLDGRIYFYELTTGEKTRAPIDIKNTIKGSVAVDHRGYPLLYAGQGLNENGRIGYRIFSLIDCKQLYFLGGSDAFAYRSWGAFDSCPLINKDTDTMILGGENGILYKVKLNTQFDAEKKTVSVDPEVVKYRYKVEGNAYQGIENSVAIYKDIIYFADNGGSIQAVNLNSMEPLWVAPRTDDTDATIALRVENDIPYLYTGCEVDKQGNSGLSTIRKINGLTGEIIGESQYLCRSILGDNPVNGGLLASPVIGQNSLDGVVIFTLARYEKLQRGLMLALSCNDGRELWRWDMPNYSWSSPVAVYDKQGVGYVVQGDSAGKLHLLDGARGSLLDCLQLNGNMESSPVVFNDYIVIATRGGTVYGVRIK